MKIYDYLPLDMDLRKVFIDDLKSARDQICSMSICNTCMLRKESNCHYMGSLSVKTLHNISNYMQKHPEVFRR